MELVLLTALGVGMATVVGALIGFCFKNVSHKFNDMILSFAAGVMMAAAVMGLVLPALESGGRFSIPMTVIGIFAGALFLQLIDRFVPHLHRLAGSDTEEHTPNQEHIHKIMLFVLAIAIHNFPEGIAAGVGFGTGNAAEALTIAGGIALQNIPEGMVIIGPMLADGVVVRGEEGIEVAILANLLAGNLYTRNDSQTILLSLLACYLNRHIQIDLYILGTCRAILRHKAVVLRLGTLGCVAFEVFHEVFLLWAVFEMLGNSHNIQTIHPRLTNTGLHREVTVREDGMSVKVSLVCGITIHARHHKLGAILVARLADMEYILIYLIYIVLRRSRKCYYNSTCQ